MPAPGEQHKSALTNPFEEIKPHINEYTAQEIATLQGRLEKQLGPEYISSRPGAAGQKVHYLAAEKCINLANEVFGFNGWSSGIRDIQVDFVDESPSTGKITLGLSVIVRVTLRDGTYHEDIGYGHIENCKGKAAAFEKAKKEGTTDALKRALRNFGNILGNCIYDKDYLARVTKLKITPSKWDADNLHRHPDYKPIKKEPASDQEDARVSTEESTSTTRGIDDEFGSAEFDEADFSVTNGGHPDEVAIDPAIIPAPTLSNGNCIGAGALSANGRAVAQPLPVPRTGLNRPPPPPVNGNTGPQTPSLSRNSYNPQQIKPGVPVYNGPTNNQKPHQIAAPPGGMSRPQGSHIVPPAGSSTGPARAGPPGQGFQGQVQQNAPQVQKSGDLSPRHAAGPLEHEPPVGFFTARAAQTLQHTTGLPVNALAFNPHQDSPSIRKTAGVDHTKSKPVGRDAIPVPCALGNTIPPLRANFVNPQADQTRRIGMPGGAASPLANRTSYKAPGMMKRPAENSPALLNRPALNDVTSASVNIPLDAGGNMKRQKVDDAPDFTNEPSVVPGR